MHFVDVSEYVLSGISLTGNKNGIRSVDYEEQCSLPGGVSTDAFTSK